MYIDHEMAEVKLRDSTVSDLGLMGQEVKAGYDSEQYFNEMKQILAAILPADNPQDTEPLQALALHHFQDQISKIFSLAPSEGKRLNTNISFLNLIANKKIFRHLNAQWVFHCNHWIHATT